LALLAWLVPTHGAQGAAIAVTGALTLGSGVLVLRSLRWFQVSHTELLLILRGPALGACALVPSILLAASNGSAGLITTVFCLGAIAYAAVVLTTDEELRAASWRLKHAGAIGARKA
jgi:O-antigen/teichoic acid export membrane protein